VLALALTLLVAAAPEAVPPAARDRYQDAVKKLAAKQYGPANDVLNGLAGEFPRVAEIFASRCSAQLGLQHWAAAEADCNYTLALKQLPTAVYGLAVAQDGLGKHALAITNYRKYAGLPEAVAAYKQHAMTRADVLSAQGNAVAPPPPPPPAAKVAKQEPPPPEPKHEPAPSKPPPGGAKGQFVPAIPDPNEALIYVYRNVQMAQSNGSTLFVDNKRIGDLWNDHYFEVRVRPGGHTITIKAMVPAGHKELEHSLSLDVEESTVSYVKLEYVGGDGDVAFRPISIGKEGRKEIRSDCELVYSKKL
jgi:hypothetical protein